MQSRAITDPAAYTFRQESISDGSVVAVTYSFLGPDPLEAQLNDVLSLLASGLAPRVIERAQVDFKEEPGRRGPAGVILPGASENEEAAKYLVAEMACFANTPGGGALILGVADRGERIGTTINADWLRHRLYELSAGKLTVTVREVTVEGTRLLVLSTHEAIEPVRYAGKVKWRVDDHCVEVDPTTWHSGKLQRSGVDWSAQPSGHAFADVSPVAIEIARRFLRQAGDGSSIDLAESTSEDLLRRLNVMSGDGRLSNAGSLLFVATPAVGIDYIRRDMPGGDSTARVRSERALLEQVAEVDQVASNLNRAIHLGGQFARGQFHALPPRALREAIVNGIVHRDWLSPQPTVVEHVGDVLTVTSPGGFIGGIGPSNIITHPSVPRYRSLSEAMAVLRLAEREGIGVDRMVSDMLGVGRPSPLISEIEGPYVRISLLGGDPDPQVVSFLSIVEPSSIGADTDALLLINRLCQTGWVDTRAAAPLLQRTLGETEAAVERLSRATVNDRPVATELAGVPAGQQRAWRLSNTSRELLASRVAHLASQPERVNQALSWAEARGRVSSTEVADMTGVTVVTAGKLLTALAEQGLLQPGRETKSGRGFFYTPLNK
jgi:ATP-dependent DNA helicase RecG